MTYIICSQRFWQGKKRSSIINAGFTIWKNCKRTQFINRKWIEAARNECKHISNKTSHNKMFLTLVFLKF